MNTTDLLQTLRGRRAAQRRMPSLHALAPYLFLAPSALLLLCFIFLPLVHGFYLSFHKWSIIGPPPEFVGIGNYVEIPNDDLFWRSIRNTLYYTAGVVPLGITIALTLALLLNRQLAFRGILRSAYFFPAIISTVVVSIVWLYMYDVQAGVLNYFLESLGLPKQKWLNDPQTAMPSVIVVSLWHSVGYNMIILLAGLQGIPADMYEAAAIDGAGRWHNFRHITLPLLRPTFLFVLITSVIGSFKVFDIVYVMTRGGPGYATLPLVEYIYFRAFESFNIGYASSLAYVFFAIVLAVTLFQLKYFGTEVDY